MGTSARPFRHDLRVPVYPDELPVVLQPLYSLHTGGVLAVEAMATGPQSIGQDVEFAARAISAESEGGALLPMHVNILAASAASDPKLLAPLVAAVHRSGLRPHDVTVEIGPPFKLSNPDELAQGIGRLKHLGFRIALDGLGAADAPLTLLASAPADMFKLDGALLQALQDNPAATTPVVEGLAHLAAQRGVRLAATSIENAGRLEAARAAGVRIVQGGFFTDDRHNLPIHTVLADHDALAPTPSPAGFGRAAEPRLTDFIRPAITMAAASNCDAVRERLSDVDGPTAIVGLDDAGRPQWTVERWRFLLKMSGRYGHALHAAKPVSRYADEPRSIPVTSQARDVLGQIAGADSGHMNDSLIVVDREGRCIGVVWPAELVRGMADAKISQAASMHPLTGLPTSDTIAKDVERRIAAGEPFVTAWLDVDEFAQVNAELGFAAGDELIAALGRTLSELVPILPRTTVCHVDADDFLMVTDPDELGTLAPALLDEEWSVDGMTVSVSLAGLVCGVGTVKTYRDVSRTLATLRKKAKQVKGNSWVLGRPGIERVDVLRGATTASPPKPRKPARDEAERQGVA